MIMIYPVLCAAIFVTGASAATVKIDWNGGMAKTATAQQGDTLSFVWSGTKPIVQVATKAEFDACNGAFSISKGTSRSPSKLVIPTTTPDGTILYFINNRAAQWYDTKCDSEGIKVAVTVSGGCGFSSGCYGAGECVAVACRIDGPQRWGTNKLTLDQRCCSIADGSVYKASCASGFTYYQWGKASTNGEWTGDTCTSSTGFYDYGTCCVASGGVVPSGATLPRSVGKNVTSSSASSSTIAAASVSAVAVVVGLLM